MTGTVGALPGMEVPAMLAAVPEAPPPTDLPVAQVLVDTGLAHLDRPFEYAVPPDLRERARPGARVKVRFAGQDLPGFVVDRRAVADHAGRLAPLRAVVSEEAVLTPPIRVLAQELARAYAGTVGDVLRLAVPPRHARAERALPLEPPPMVSGAVPRVSQPGAEPAPGESSPGPEGESPAAKSAEPEGESPAGPEGESPAGPVARDRGDSGSAWASYPAGAALLRRLARGESPSAAWCAVPSAAAPGLDWPMALAQAVQATLASGRGSIVVVPDHRDVDRLDAALLARLGPGQHVLLRADQGPQARYTAWLKVLRGHARVAIGTRAAAYAPVRGLGLIAVWDDGDDLLEEPRAPYVHAAEVARRRARIEGAGLLLGGFGRSVRTQALVAAGLPSIVAGRAIVRRQAPAVSIAGEGEREQERDPAAASARLPSQAWQVAKTALASGPVLIQVPRRGYLPALACTTCRARVRCPHCRGPLQLPDGGAAPECRWCGRSVAAWSCPACEGTGLRSLVVGARRTAEELGRAFPGFPVLTSGAGTVLAHIPDRPAIVIATPGAEPVADGGYAAALLLDAWALIDRPALDAAPESLRRWLAAAALVRGRGAAPGGRVVLCGLSPHGPPVPAAEALVRWDPVWLAALELRDREVLRLPPAAIFAEVTGPRAILEAVATRPGLPAGVERFGPVPGVGPGLGSGPAPRSGPAPGFGRGRDDDTAYRLLLRAEPGDAEELAADLRALRSERSARKEADAVRMRVGVADID